MKNTDMVIFWFSAIYVVTKTIYIGMWIAPEGLCNKVTEAICQHGYIHWVADRLLSGSIVNVYQRATVLTFTLTAAKTQINTTLAILMLKHYIVWPKTKGFQLMAFMYHAGVLTSSDFSPPPGTSGGGKTEILPHSTFALVKDLTTSCTSVCECFSPVLQQ